MENQNANSGKRLSAPDADHRQPEGETAGSGNHPSIEKHLVVGRQGPALSAARSHAGAAHHGVALGRHPRLDREGVSRALTLSWAVKVRRINPRLVKIHCSYTVEEIADLFGKHNNTVRAWINEGGIADVRRQAPYDGIGGRTEGVSGGQVFSCPEPYPPDCCSVG